ncbi:MAG: zinc ABC transporter substrate-binding protein [Candidatus Liptonbacteria bacterium]|nr:zinc ABC transporter substrate-binding protein [Candidatus Liptonbacteria bacterium]
MKKNYGLWILFIAAIAALLFWAGKNAWDNPAGMLRDGRPQVVASFYPLYYFASQIAGDKANVTVITPATVEPHDYELTPRDLERIVDSKMLVLNGGNLETWGDKIKNELAGSGVIVVIAGEGLANNDLTENGRRIADPHIWLDPVLAKKEVENIENGFIKMDPANASYYQTNAFALKARLDELDREYEGGLNSCRLREIVTSHASFGYLAARYHLNQVAIGGVSPDAEPSSQAMAEIVDLVRLKGIKVIFFESLVSPKISQTIAEETGASTIVLDPLEGLTGADMKSGADYMTVMRQNLKNLEVALQCEVM